MGSLPHTSNLDISHLALNMLSLGLMFRALSIFNIRVGNGSRTRQSSVFLRRTEVWRLQLP
jgi:hypothetical protein